MRVFDLHSDLFTDIAMRKSAGEKDVFDRVHYPKLKMGGVASLICVFWVEPKFRNLPYDRFQTLFQLVMEDLRSSKHAAISHPSFNQQNHTDSEQVEIFLGLEGLSFIEGWQGDTTEEKIENAFHSLNESGIIHSIFAWNEHNFLATGTGAENPVKQQGLTPYGKHALFRSNNFNWLLDASHLDESSFWDMYHFSDRPFMASHSNAKSICHHDRNLTDEQLKAIANRGGVIGLNAFGAFVDAKAPTVDTFIDHAVYIANLIGPEHLAFGFDFVDYLQSYDLGSKFTVFTKDLEDSSKIPLLLDKMSKRGFTNKELEAISFTNAYQYITNQCKDIGGESN